MDIKELVKLSKELSKEEVKLNNHHSLYFETEDEIKKYNGEYCLIKVLLPFCNCEYWFASNYFDIMPGNYVLVYTGNGTNRFITEVVEIGYFKENELPYPIEKIKLIKQVFDSNADIKRITELKTIVNKYPPIKGINHLEQF